jgi:hypothetical protein
MNLKEAQCEILRLCKWRVHFASWLFGTRPKDDPQAQWARDTAEKLLLYRVETNALARVLIEAGLTDPEKFTIMIGEEAVFLMKSMEERWPGARASENGMTYNGEEVARWMKNWLP